MRPANFFASGPLALDRKLGPLLWQLPPNLGFDAERLDSFFTLLPRTTAQAASSPPGTTPADPDDRALLVAAHPEHLIRHALEVRHDSFRSPELILGAARARRGPRDRRQPGKWPVLDETTTDFRYVRLHGDTELYASGYSDAALDSWAARIGVGAAAGQDVYVYCDNDAKVRAPYDAMGLMERLGLGGEPPGRTKERSLAHPKELTYPCCLPALGELGEVSPREGPPTSVQDLAGPDRVPGSGLDQRALRR